MNQGDYATAQKVAENAVETARRFANAGARWLHVVDLDGAKAAKPLNDSTIFEIVKDTQMHVEVGGGIRDMNTVEYYLQNGVSRIILGSAALRSPEFVKEAVQKYGKKIAVGIDARDGKVAAEGWLETSDVDYLEMAKRMEDIGVRYLIVTDISKDGAMQGANVCETIRMQKETELSVIASGGVSSLRDLENLRDSDIYGAVLGKALYSGAIDLKEALALADQG